jgi:hypothetical protein
MPILISYCPSKLVIQRLLNDSASTSATSIHERILEIRRSNKLGVKTNLYSKYLKISEFAMKNGKK